MDDEIIGSSTAIEYIRDIMIKAGKNTLPILLLGEIGTGKNMAARWIHKNFGYSGSLLLLNCSTTSIEMIEKQIFNDSNNSYHKSQVIQKRKPCDNIKTIVFDRICNVDREYQLKLADLVDEIYFFNSHQIKNNYKKIQLIFKSDQAINEKINHKLMMPEFFYKINPLLIELPPLRDRSDDIIELAEYFVKIFEKETGLLGRKITDDAKKQLLQHEWPGNIRELESVIRSSVILNESQYISDLNINRVEYLDNKNSNHLITNQKEKTLRELEDMIFASRLKKFDNNVSKTAESLGVGQATVYRRKKNLHS